MMGSRHGRRPNPDPVPAPLAPDPNPDPNPDPKRARNGPKTRLRLIRAFFSNYSELWNTTLELQNRNFYRCTYSEI